MAVFLSSEKISEVAELLAKDELVAFPTETVYGLGGNAYSDNAVAKIFACKHRSEFNPLSVCYSSFEKASADVIITKYASIIAEKFLPGSITLLLKRKKNSRLSMLCSAGLDTIGIRIPSNEIALSILSKLAFPLAAPSANSSGQLSHTTAKEVAEDLKNITILDGGKCNIGIESTIIDCSGEKLVITRQGVISTEEIIEKCGINRELILFSEKPKKFSFTKKILLNTQSSEIVGKNDALLAFGPSLSVNCKYVLNLSPSKNLNEATANFFSMLKTLENSDVEKICVMPIPNISLGQAINKRLKSLL
ncbi:MAG: threonylcarbamoyl-AMP synthase [Alphaproteobacteria bacterium]|nr:threonylcarbamoyl-AMP synthase [Alphaproteobacteria bacterium]